MAERVVEEQYSEDAWGEVEVVSLSSQAGASKALISSHETIVAGTVARATPERPVRILVADDHDLVLETIAAFLVASKIGEVQVANDFAGAMDLVRRLGSFDLIILDYNMPGMKGVESIHRIRMINNNGPVAIMSGSASREVSSAAIKSGAAGFIPKTLPPRSLVTAIQFMLAGEIFVPVEMLLRPAEKSNINFTERELEVLRLICSGSSNKEIEARIGLQGIHVRAIIRTLNMRLGTRNRTQLAMIAIESNLIQI